MTLQRSPVSTASRIVPSLPLDSDIDSDELVWVAESFAGLPYGGWNTANGTVE
jgi:hypothetical protein